MSFALDMKTGKVAWKTADRKVAERLRPSRVAPLYYDGNDLQRKSRAASFGVRGRLTAPRCQQNRRDQMALGSPCPLRARKGSEDLAGRHRSFDARRRCDLEIRQRSIPKLGPSLLLRLAIADPTTMARCGEGDKPVLYLHGGP